MPPGHPRAGEKNVADFLAATAAAAGLEVEFQPVFPSRSNVIVRLLPAGTTRQSVLLAPHLDTVGADGTQFIPQRRNGRLYGRGACDTKGSVAAMLSALTEVAASKIRPRHTEIIFAGLIDEENAQAGSRALVKNGRKAQLAIVGEPTRNRIITAHKGCVWLSLTTAGRAAHGAMPHLGKNAVLEMARAVDLLETAYATRLQKRRHKLLGHGTVNVGKISGGTQPNIVPDSCVIEIDRRTLPGETENSVRREIAALLSRRKIRARITSFKDAPAFPLETDPKLPLVQTLLRTANQLKPLGVDYFCDASVLAAGGIPSVVFGPGNIAQAHTSDEWISLKELERAKDMLVAFLKTLP